MFDNSELLCRLYGYVMSMTTLNIRLSYLCLAMDRMSAVAFPIWYRVHGKRRNGALVTLATFVATTAISTPYILYSGIIPNYCWSRLIIKLSYCFVLFTIVSAQTGFWCQIFNTEFYTKLYIYGDYVFNSGSGVIINAVTSLLLIRRWFQARKKLSATTNSTVSLRLVSSWNIFTL